MVFLFRHELREVKKRGRDDAVMREDQVSLRPMKRGVSHPTRNGAIEACKRSRLVGWHRTSREKEENKSVALKLERR